MNIRHLSAFRLIAIIMLLTLPGSSLSAATVSTFTGGDPGEGLDLTGLFVYAIDTGSNGTGGIAGPDRPVGDAVFQDNFAGGNLIAGTSPFWAAVNNWGTEPSLGVSANDNNLEDVLHDIGIPHSSGRLSNSFEVIPGAQYKVQLILSENFYDGTGQTREQDVVIYDGLYNGTTGGGQTIIDTVSNLNVLGITGAWNAAGAPNTGVVVTSEFTALSNVFTISTHAPASPTGGLDTIAIMNAITVEQIVPEPSTLGLVMVGVLGLTARTRRNRQRLSGAASRAGVCGIAAIAVLAAMCATTASTAVAAPVPVFVSYGFTSQSDSESPITPTGIGVIGSSAADMWMLETANTVTDTTPNALLDVTGSATPYTFAHSAFSAHSTAGPNFFGANEPTAISPFQNSWFSGAEQSYTFGGFNKGDSVDLVLFGDYHRGFRSDGTSFTIGGTTLSTVGQLAVNTAYLQGTNYVQFDDLVVGASGTISVSMVGNPAPFVDVNGFQLSVTPAVPEPSSAVLVCVAAILGLARRPRRRRESLD